mgnify:CR=1 FL=1
MLLCQDISLPTFTPLYLDYQLRTIIKRKRPESKLSGLMDPVNQPSEDQLRIWLDFWNELIITITAINNAHFDSGTKGRNESMRLDRQTGR